MLDFLIPGRPGHSTTDILIQVATLTAGLLIAAALKFGIDRVRRK